MLLFHNQPSEGSNTIGSDINKAMKEGLACNFDFLEDELVSEEFSRKKSNTFQSGVIGRQRTQSHAQYTQNNLDSAAKIIPSVE